MNPNRLWAALVFAASLSGCSGPALTGPVSEVAVDESQIENLPVGISVDVLQQRFGPPAMRRGYKNLNETVYSWRMWGPGGQRMFFNAHLDPATQQVRYYSRSFDAKGRR